jgi:mRNA guanylyltransferase
MEKSKLEKKTLDELFKDSPEAKLLTAPGVKLDANKHASILRDINQNLVEIFEQISKRRSKGNYFLGSHPKSLTKEFLNKVASNINDFLVCEKSDGVRYMLLVTNMGDCIMSSRNDDFQLVKIKIPKNLCDEVQDEDQKVEIKYIFDGELVLDKYLNKATGKEDYDLSYLLFDCIYFNGKTVHNLDYIYRLEHAQRFLYLIKSSRDILTKVLKDKNPDQEIAQLGKRHPMSMYLKDFFHPSDSYFLLDKFVHKLPHHNDGLIYTQISEPYIVGGTDSILKWKEPDQNTVDFLVVNNLNFDEDKYGKRIVDLYVNQQNRELEESELMLFDFMVVDEDMFERIGDILEIKEPMDDLNYKNKAEKEFLIAECRFDPHADSQYIKELCKDYMESGDLESLISTSTLSSRHSTSDDVKENLRLCFEKRLKANKGNWVINKFRKDKKLPNATMTAKNVFRSITENLSKKDLQEKLQRKAMLPAQQNPQANQMPSNMNIHNSQQARNQQDSATYQEPQPQKKLKPNGQSQLNLLA